MSVKEMTNLRGKLPFPSWMQIFCCAIAIALTISAWFQGREENDDLVGITALFGGLLILRLLFDLGYQAWYSDSRIYVRSDGLGWVIGRPTIESIALADIEYVEGAFGRDQVLQRRFMPFEYIRLEGATEAKEGFVMIAPNSLKVDDVRSLLLLIEERRPGALSEDVAKFARASAPW